MPPRRRSVAFAEIEAPANVPADRPRAQAALADFAILASTIDAETAPDQGAVIAGIGQADVEHTSGDPTLPHIIGRAAVADTAALDTNLEAATTDATSVADHLPAPASITQLELQEPGPVITVRDFSDMFERYQTPIVNFIYRSIGNREEAYDLAQDVFVKAFRSLDGGIKIQAGAFASWLYKIASNTTTDWLRRRRLINWLPLSIFTEDRGVGVNIGTPDGTRPNHGRDAQAFDTAVTSASTVMHDSGRFEDRLADREIVGLVLNGLREKYREALLLYEHQGFSVQEIADLLDVTTSTVKMRLMRGREQFIALYKQETGEHPGQVFVRKPSRRVRKQAAPALAAV